MNVSGRTNPENTSKLGRAQLRPGHFTEEMYRCAREEHTQKRFVPRAMDFSLETASRWKPAVPRPESKGGGRAALRSPSTFLWDRSNVKRKPSARGRTR